LEKQGKAGIIAETCSNPDAVETPLVLQSGQDWIATVKSLSSVSLTRRQADNEFAWALEMASGRLVIGANSLT